MTALPRVAVLGAAGYAGQELSGILTAHPGVELEACMSARANHTPPGPAFPGDTLIEPLDLDRLGAVQGVFLCTPHRAAAELAVACLERGCKVVDLSADFRLRDAEVYAATYGQRHAAPHLLDAAVYGLSEFHRDEIRDAFLVANPGCYPTSILLPLLPLLDAGLVAADAPIIADSKSGVSGAGKAPMDRTVYGAIAENFLAYDVGQHRHAPEIWQAAGTDRVVFVPHLLPMFRGMLSTIYITPAANGDMVGAADAVRARLVERYRDEAFIEVFAGEFAHCQPETNRVAGTNQCHIAVAVAGSATGSAAGSQIVLTSVIDNLGKGAAGQAVQNMNLMLGLAETAGLR